MTAAADALASIWRDPDQVVPLAAAALRASTGFLASHCGDALWYPDGTSACFVPGNSLLHAACTPQPPATGQHAAADSDRILNQDHPETPTARANLAASYQQARHPADAQTATGAERHNRQEAARLGPRI